ncbi:hypothetical protein CAPTEDRAFT_92917 [Capitella teleta]|uniref:G-protein coupled receptors family 1 profile domain-containing protein n=1 Tax=Capitella teleta TaxID=283909 RepID=R7VIV6_CAPTE|nr:hypothetical protein CAPTEDRAFT_92917 [Capitella teleta]|eukprot:ELU15645.1 hypothetical protein CAPTEDRAFT_92917 [Capitella teleta]
MIAADRYLAIMHPLLYQKAITPARLKIAVLFSWVTSLLWTMIAFAFQTDVGNCYTLASADGTYVMTFIIVPYFLTCPVFILMHARVWKVATAQVRQIKAEITASQGDTKIIDEHRATKMCVLTLLAFILLTVPFFVVVSMQIYADRLSEKGKKLQVAFSICWTLLYSNSGVNFLIYAFGNSVFREKLMNILPKCCPLKRNLNPQGASG